MIEHTYFVGKTSWCINIKIFADYTNFEKLETDSKCVKVTEKIWMRFADKPMMEKEIFCNDDLPYLMKGLQIVKNQIISNSKFDNTLITIHSLQFSICDFQEEGLTVAMVEWAAKAFGFNCPRIKVEFDKPSNRYVFDLSVGEDEMDDIERICEDIPYWRKPGDSCKEIWVDSITSGLRH